MKKTLLVVFAIATMFNLNAQKKVAYVTDTTTAYTPYLRDSLILPMLKADPNFVVTKIQSTVAGQDLSGYDLIFIAEAPSSASAIMATIKGIAKPILNMKTFVYKSSTGCWYWAVNASLVDNATALSVIVNHPGHPILTGINVSKGDSIQMLTKVRQALAATPGAYKGLNGATNFVSVANGVVDTIAVIKGAATGQISIFEVPVGTVMNGTTGSTVNGKYIHIGINGASWNNITPQGLLLIKNAAYYLTGLTIPAGVKNPTMALGITQTTKELKVDTQENLDLSIYSVSGQRVSKTIGNSISIANLNTGIYILKMTTGNGLNQTYKFSK
jgi:hypothetical protein